jgi:hypothetical protein
MNTLIINLCGLGLKLKRYGISVAALKELDDYITVNQITLSELIYDLDHKDFLTKYIFNQTRTPYGTKFEPHFVNFETIID